MVGVSLFVLSFSHMNMESRCSLVGGAVCRCRCARPVMQFCKSLGCQTGLRQDIVGLWLLVVYLCGECEVNSLDSGSFVVGREVRFGGFCVGLTQLIGISEFPKFT